MPFYLLLALGTIADTALSGQFYLYNGVIKAGFGHTELETIHDLETAAEFNIEDAWQVKIQTVVNDSANISTVLKPSTDMCKVEEAGGSGCQYRVNWNCMDKYNVTVIYRLREAERFLSKMITIHSPVRHYLQELTVWNTSMASSTASFFQGWMPAKSPNRWNQNADIVGFARWPNVSAFFSIANPFNELHASKTYYSDFLTPRLLVEGKYSPAMWQGRDSLEGTYEADTGIFGFASRGKYSYPTGVNAGEVDAFKKSAATLFLDSELQNKTLKVHVAWAENDYQIDVGTDKGQFEYRRIFKRAAQLGVDYVVYEPRNTAHLTEFNATDGWGLERTWWFSLGEKMRAGLWHPTRDRVPRDIMDMIEYARRRCGGIRLLAYVYPLMPFEELRMYWTEGTTKMLDLGNPIVAGWLLETLVAFLENTGAGGFAWDYDIFTGSSTQAYSQWYSWMWVLKKLRAQFPDIVMHHRQHHGFGPWYQFAGSYAVPLQSDGQPESYGVHIPSLHTDHVAADQLRRVNFAYATEQLMPSRRIPGFMFHQSEARDNRTGNALCNALETRDCYDWNVRDFDYMGYKYSVLSSVATAGLNNILNFIPARDRGETAVDVSFIRQWLDWADDHMIFLGNAAPIPTLPSPTWGSVDGWHALSDNSGFVFLFNPNFKQMEVTITLDESVGISNASLGTLDRWMVLEKYPHNGTGASGPWRAGENVTLKVGGSDAMVLYLEKHPAGGLAPSVGSGPTGTWRRVPVSVNGLEAINCSHLEDDTEYVWVKFNGTKMYHAMPISDDVVPASFQHGWFNTSFSVPAGIQSQLDATAQSLKMSWTTQDNATSWLNPTRLLMTIFYDQPDETIVPRLFIDGHQMPLQKAYNSRDALRQAKHENTFMGYYYDATNLSLDDSHRRFHASVWMPDMQPPLGSGGTGVVYPGENIYPCGKLGCKMPVDAIVDDCRLLCSRYSRCIAYVWDPKGCDQYTNKDHNTCWLKGRVYKEAPARSCLVSEIIRRDAQLNRFQGLFWENIETEYTDELVDCIAYRAGHGAKSPASFLGVDAKGAFAESQRIQRHEHRRLVRVHLQS
mmetsp:Transcript_99656/g.181800  ORF Transcript_99656/g.181800 Transcript_99656/m.181800 type:complete len:1071 (+) Transcript_99656:82-3294(+)